jgi:hypothetical protein
VGPGSHFDLESADLFDDLNAQWIARAGPIEGRVEAVASRVVLFPTPPREFFTDDRVMSLDERLPCEVAHRRLIVPWTRRCR